MSPGPGGRRGQRYRGARRSIPLQRPRGKGRRGAVREAGRCTGAGQPRGAAGFSPIFRVWAAPVHLPLLSFLQVINVQSPSVGGDVRDLGRDLQTVPPPSFCSGPADYQPRSSGARSRAPGPDKRDKPFHRCLLFVAAGLRVDWSHPRSLQTATSNVPIAADSTSTKQNYF